MMIMRKMPRRQNVGTPSQFREMTRTAASLHFSTHVPGLYISYFSTGACDYARLQILLFCTFLISTILHLVTLTWTQVSTLLDCANYMCLVHTSHLLVTVFFSKYVPSSTTKLLCTGLSFYFSINILSLFINHTVNTDLDQDPLQRTCCIFSKSRQGLCMCSTLAVRLRFRGEIVFLAVNVNP